MVGFAEGSSKEAFKQIVKQFNAKAQDMQTADGDATLSNWIAPALFSALGIDAISGVRVVTEDAVFQPNLVLPKTGASGHIAGADLKGKQAGQELSCLIWALPWRASLDSVATEPPFVSLPVTEVAHRALAASDVPWAIITNGRQLRLLSRASSHKPRCFLEADLVALVDRRDDPQAARAFRFLLGLFSGKCFTDHDEAGHTLLDRVAQGSDRHGKEIGDELKANVFSALQELGEGFLECLRANPQDAAEWRDRRAPGIAKDKFLKSDVLLDEIYHESLSLMYRLLFLFYAESRELLPLDNELYQTYSLESIRDDVHSVLDDPDPKRFFAKGNTSLWARLKELFGFLDKGWGKVIPPYNGGLFDQEKHEFLERFAVGDYYLAQAIDLLSRTKPRAGQNRGEGRKKVTYRDLDVRHLGSIYEGILEYTAHIADQDYVIIRDGSGGHATEEYIAVGQLNRDQMRQFNAWKEAVADNPDNPRLPKGCRMTGKVDTGQYYLAFGGRESKRKSSGSYYTPDHIVQFIVENTLGPLVRGECRPQPLPMTAELSAIGWREEAASTDPLTAEEILDLKVVDPAMGSGHFLVAATEFLARAYRDARLSKGAIVDESQAEQEFIRYKRVIAERCIYGVDLNPMAVQLAKLSMWLFTMDPGRPLSFLDHHLKTGNAILGGWLHQLGTVPSHLSPPQLKGLTSTAQLNLFEQQFSSRLPAILADVFRILERETVSTQDVHDKKVNEAAIDMLRKPFVVTADNWLSFFFEQSSIDYLTLLSNVDKAPADRPTLADNHAFFHWELEFPEVYFNKNGTRRQKGGFDAVVGNPPYIDSEVMSREHPVFRRVATAITPGCSGNWDMYCAFIGRGLQLTGQSGIYSQIVPNKLFAADYAEEVQGLIRTKATLLKVADFSRAEVFPGVAVYPVIPVIKNRPSTKGCAVDVQVMLPSALERVEVGTTHQVSINVLAELPGTCWAPVLSPDWPMVQKILSTSVDLGEVAMVTGSATVGEAYELKPLIFDASGKTAAGETFRIINSGTIDRYRSLWGEKSLQYLKDAYARPMIRRIDFADAFPNRLKETSSRKIILAGMTSVLEAILDEGGMVVAKSCVLVRNASPAMSYFLLGLINSSISTYVFRRLFDAISLQGGYLRIGPPQVKRLPVPLASTRVASKYLKHLDDAFSKAGAVSPKEGPEPELRALQSMLTVAGAARTLMLHQSELKEQEAERLERSIDMAVGALFGLTPIEVDKIREWFQGRDSGHALQ
ncbi:MAG: BREX-1 system adenine-specific DNA-methyltransferase PglX [Bryobacterales bacterium]|nr:BREX-1 system adenine-specific DNA-methyltransferase PglX [Bryobacterales bacterium]